MCAVVDIDAKSMMSSTPRTLEACSESDSDMETPTFASVWHDAQADSSENESADSEYEDPLK